MSSSSCEIKMSFNASADSNFSDAKLVLERCLVAFIIHFPTRSYTWSLIIACVVNIVFCIAGTILNSLVLYIFWKSSKMRSKLSYFAIMLLCSADLAVVTIVHPLFLVQAIKEIDGTPNCTYNLFYLGTLYFFTGMSIATLLILNLERYTAIIHPIWHRKKVTKRRLMYIWAILWLVIVVNTVSFFLYWRLSTMITIILISTLCLTSLFTYISIFRIARKRKNNTPCNALGDHTNCDNCQGSGNMAAFLRELKMAKTYFTIVVLGFLCFVPAAIVLRAFKYPWNESEKEPSAIAYTWAKTLTSTNSTLNCLIFFWANKMLRREALKRVKNFSSIESTS